MWGVAFHGHQPVALQHGRAFDHEAGSMPAHRAEALDGNTRIVPDAGS